MRDRALELVVEAGKTMLENGGEVFRAQDTMEIMARSLGVEGFHVYVLTNGIFASAESAAGESSAVRHIPRVRIHLGRVEAVNALSRRLAAGQTDLPGAEAALAEARALPEYGPRMAWLAGAVGSACFGYLFGGAAPEIVTAFLPAWPKCCCCACLRAAASARYLPTLRARLCARRCVWPPRRCGAPGTARRTRSSAR